MTRALLTAPVARDLQAECAAQSVNCPTMPVVRVPGATNGTLQGWDTLDADYWTQLADPQITIYTTVASIPNAVKLYLFQVLRWDDAGCTVNPRFRRGKDLALNADFWHTVNGGVAVTRNGPPIAGDRPTPGEWDLMHRWSGNPMDTMGTP